MFPIPRFIKSITEKLLNKRSNRLLNPPETIVIMKMILNILCLCDKQYQIARKQIIIGIINKIEYLIMIFQSCPRLRKAP